MSKILLIEDEINLLESLEIILEASGLETLSATNGMDGLALLHNEATSVDLILCDINLPDITGYDVLKEVKADNELYKIPFIFLTAYADEKDIRTGMNMGADDYMTKPFSAKELIETIKARISVQAAQTKHTEKELNNKWLSILNASFRQEFFTPINGILNASMMLGSAEIATCTDADVLINTIKAIYTSSFRMYRNARNLMLYSLISTHQPVSSNSNDFSRSVNNILKEVIGWYHNKVTNNILDISVADNEIPLRGIDYELLSILFTELIDNALKFNNAADKPPYINLSTTESGFIFTITNYTTEVVSFNLHNLQPFTKMHKDETYIGLGLGLYLCVNIANSIGCHLSLSTHSGVVTFTLSA